MRVLGIEGTAWCASAAIHDAETDDVFIESDAYEPDSGGIHPREAAEHMAETLPEVIDAALSYAEDTAGAGGIDAVAFSRGPGLGPCLRTVGTAARAVAGTLDVPLVGVNHMVAHLEIGRHRSGFEDPICLNASGANAHVLGYHDGRYRVLGETMDTGVGNAIDKFTRHVGWTHPGGPKVERAAADGEYVDLPYVVKGMDFSFSGIMSAAKDLYDEGVPVEDVCFSLQEHVFAMLTEVAERALSLTGNDQLVLGGGVGQNDRLREMLATMCAQRGVAFHAPEPRFLRDNAGMIAVLGARMLAAGDTVPISESAIDPNYRPDQVPVTWRGTTASSAGSANATEIAADTAETVPDAADAATDAATTAADASEDVTTRAATDRGDALDLRGAEAAVEIIDEATVRKRRRPKAYRHPTLDETLRRNRTTLEARLLNEARRAGVPTPLVHDVDVANAELTLQYVGTADLAERITPDRVREVGAHLARLHRAGFVHGDPTTRNVRVGESAPTLIDFGLGYHTGHVEDHAMDLHILEQSIRGTATDPDPLVSAAESGYAAVGETNVLDRLRTIEGRGRYR
ncbi:bifunctional N(6)-L-threonylcarbamoyladenine synthase/serine/threonine protein kinase [Halopenitus persicus]|uniref:Probable bifunctional tRNA threonylcarbamoyladenosine biosynthesis protein n=1 Tax=Halopenitus persicus TaxID=1048396 RepID=A0A1H3KIR8_9EURY|nr:bifunctional N(6)-L-threonylcarbamoyladenine synthase/serine/threonine protein kinase [Halopenitus persicus]SDY52037.1 bifunctional N6-L-threonylcarbamoyladenine synthase / protein kinase Bud32 [Halopenitus persicus]